MCSIFKRDLDVTRDLCKDPGGEKGSRRVKSREGETCLFCFSFFLIFSFPLEEAHNDSVTRDQQKYMCISMCGKKKTDEIYRNHAAIVVHPLTHLYRWAGVSSGGGEAVLKLINIYIYIVNVYCKCIYDKLKRSLLQSREVNTVIATISLPLIQVGPFILGT